ncbi:hypothetical protein LEP1GSC196_1211 [Leptospira meyeri serovar Semaranga str. Veldrot Semarang 173]|nr:hypothetical protein LEP1GSC196_1211 [Leptospira meyeri serovar Semaranga str. Veldrot Semarang 173]
MEKPAVVWFSGVFIFGECLVKKWIFVVYFAMSVEAGIN